MVPYIRLRSENFLKKDTSLHRSSFANISSEEPDALTFLQRCLSEEHIVVLKRNPKHIT